jgi:hypothetical protein
MEILPPLIRPNTPENITNSELVDWFPIQHIDWNMLCLNNSNGAIQLLMNNPNKINWHNLSKNNNEYAVDLLLENVIKIDWVSLCENTNDRALELLKQRPDKIYWGVLSANPAEIALDLIYKYFENNKIDILFWTALSGNSNDRALDLLLNNYSKIYWNNLSKNSNDRALQLLIDNPTKINWDNLSINPNERALELLLNNPSKINKCIMSNSNAKCIDIIDTYGHLLYKTYVIPKMQLLNLYVMKNNIDAELFEEYFRIENFENINNPYSILSKNKNIFTDDTPLYVLK